ncbi:MAG TPA: hypothetical protein PLL30_03300 [Candidatus Krumholzibacteria bacterium]|nr:hypothetical protein [Candidatus Krumholzibacteria bacterium]HPD70799.1 hypothetical protein [Candidatus Krumholzibacteria bacterium]HRY39501.1 hypothetical protein [Candidatus Krumholzibacteria bacterium]
MNEQWIRADKIVDPSTDIRWDTDISAHPLLDPEFLQGPSRLYRFLQLTLDQIRADETIYQREAARLVRPLRGGSAEIPPCADDVFIVAEFLHEADVYLQSTIELLPDAARAHVAPLPAVVATNDLRELLGLAFTGGDRRLGFEALRKIHLANLLLDIDHSRHVQDGPLHLAYFQELLDRCLWRYKTQAYPVNVGFHIDQDGETIRYSTKPRPDDQVWHFDSAFLEKRGGSRPVSLDVLYHSCRFKRSVDRVSYEIVDGQHRVMEKVRWQEMKQHRSGSILSKMLRKGINNPDEIGDILGAVFIVHDEDALDDLIWLLDSGIGNPFGWRNISDTLGPEPAGARLNLDSGRGFRVFKGDVDILFPGRFPGQAPYRFTVEIQVHTLESFLRTVCGAHQANHVALKLRQFLLGLVPVLFPAAIYGKTWLRLP